MVGDNMKEYYRKEIVRVSRLLNMSEVCKLVPINYENFKKFKKGDLGKISEEKARKIIEVINSIHIDI